MRNWCRNVGLVVVCISPFTAFWGGITTVVLVMLLGLGFIGLSARPRRYDVRRFRAHRTGKRRF